MDAFEIGYTVGVLAGMFGMYAVVHTVIVSFWKSYATRTKYERFLVWYSASYLALLLLIVLVG